MTLGCALTIDVGQVSPGVYEIAMLDTNADSSVIGRGAIPVSSPLDPICGDVCDPVEVAVAPCGVTNVDIEVTCAGVSGVDDGCGGA